VPVGLNDSRRFRTWEKVMQGTVLMLMALSGLGCHNKGCDVVYAATDV